MSEDKKKCVVVSGLDGCSKEDLIRDHQEWLDGEKMSEINSMDCRDFKWAKLAAEKIDSNCIQDDYGYQLTVEDIRDLIVGEYLKEEEITKILGQEFISKIEEIQTKIQ